MRKPPPLPEGSKEKLHAALKRARTKGQYQMVLCLWLRAALELTSGQIALALGMSSSGVRRIQARWAQLGEAMFNKPGKGGPHHRHLPKKLERAFLDRLLKTTLPANAIMNTRFIQEAYETMTGQPVSSSAIYRMLKRHGWRPVAEVDMATPQRWAAARLAFEDELPGNGESALSDAELETELKN